MKADAKGLDKEKQKPNIEPKDAKPQAESPREKTPEKDKLKENLVSPPPKEKSIFKKYQLDAKEILEIPKDLILPKKYIFIYPILETT